ncbi:hypothetical protein JW905_17265 [bacterium]|nr:hypothetical protein [candidate division CSSED10-310 bacterium]
MMDGWRLNVRLEQCFRRFGVGTDENLTAIPVSVPGFFHEMEGRYDDSFSMLGVNRQLKPAGSVRRKLSSASPSMDTNGLSGQRHRTKLHRVTCFPHDTRAVYCLPVGRRRDV